MDEISQSTRVLSADLLLSQAIEAAEAEGRAELAECFQWLTPEESYLIEDKEKVADEIADVLIYLLNLCDKMKINPISAVNEKMQKNRARFPISS